MNYYAMSLFKGATVSDVFATSLAEVVSLILHLKPVTVTQLGDQIMGVTELQKISRQGNR